MSSSQLINDFLYHRRKQVIVLTLLLLLAAGGFIVFAFRENSRNARAAVRAEELRKEEANYTKMPSGAGRDQARGELEKKTKQFLKTYGKSPAAEEVYYRQAKREEKDRRWDAAFRIYGDLIRNFPRGYLRAPSLFSMANLKEQAGKPQESLEILQKMYKKKETGSYKPLVLFNTARIYDEVLNKPKEAEKFYEKLVNEFNDNTFAKLAKSRLIMLKIKAPSHEKTDGS